MSLFVYAEELWVKVNSFTLTKSKKKSWLSYESKTKADKQIYFPFPLSPSKIEI